MHTTLCICPYFGIFLLLKPPLCHNLKTDLHIFFPSALLLHMKPLFSILQLPRNTFSLEELLTHSNSLTCLLCASSFASIGTMKITTAHCIWIRKREGYWFGYLVRGIL